MDGVCPIGFGRFVLCLTVGWISELVLPNQYWILFTELVGKGVCSIDTYFAHYVGCLLDGIGGYMSNWC